MPLADIAAIPRYRQFSAREHGCQLWWIEWGGRLDTVHETESIKWELWRIVYGVWDHIKNSGRFSEAETLTLEWVGQIPGKRESRRFEGDYMLTQRDVVDRRPHADAVASGGWAIDLHPADGVYSAEAGCSQWHAKGVYGIPYRCLYSRDVANLFLAGRIISASHVAFGSTRVMATCAQGGQAVGMAAALCRRDGLRPRDLTDPPRLRELQRALLRSGQHIPGISLDDPDDIAAQAEVTSTSRLLLDRLEPDGSRRTLDDAWAMLLPVGSGPLPRLTFELEASRPTRLTVELRISGRPGEFTPDRTLAAQTVELAAPGPQPVTIDFGVTIDGPRYAFVCLLANPMVTARCSERRATGVLSLAHRRTARWRRRRRSPRRRGSASRASSSGCPSVAPMATTSR